MWKDIIGYKRRIKDGVFAADGKHSFVTVDRSPSPFKIPAGVEVKKKC